MVFNAPFNNISVSFIGGENWSTRRKPLTCRKSLTNFVKISLISFRPLLFFFHFLFRFVFVDFVLLSLVSFYFVFISLIYKVRNEIETNRNEINENETKRNEINKNETKRNQRNENEIKRNQRKQNEMHSILVQW
jgi:Ca2+/Na+ antiporter